MQATDYLQPVAFLSVGFHICRWLRNRLQAVRTHFVQYSDAALLQKGTHALHHIIIALDYSHSRLVVAHHGEKTESGKALFLCLQA